jgi:hypothetical protein
MEVPPSRFFGHILRAFTARVNCRLGEDSSRFTGIFERAGLRRAGLIGAS